MKKIAFGLTTVALSLAAATAQAGEVETVLPLQLSKEFGVFQQRDGMSADCREETYVRAAENPDAAVKDGEDVEGVVFGSKGHSQK